MTVLAISISMNAISFLTLENEIAFIEIEIANCEISLFAISITPNVISFLTLPSIVGTATTGD